MSVTVPEIPTFRYEPLNRTKRSIRLIAILPDLSVNGLIQCKIWHDTVNAKYTCLSYTWGSKDDEQLVLMNGHTFHVRRNLWDFMVWTRKKYAERPRALWIDAMSINQDSVAERNHQVAQMDQVYSNAVEVLSWLGTDECTRRAVAAMLPSPFPAKFTGNEIATFETWDRLNLCSNGQFRRDWSAVVKNDYWRRAWITQEILLAKKLIISAGEHEIESKNFSLINHCVGNMNDCEGDVWVPPGEWNYDMRVFKTYMDAFYKRPPSKQKLIGLFYQLPGRLCERPLDRVYSLLSIASDASAISVDYTRPISHVLLQLVRVNAASMCVCFWFLIVHMLKLRLGPWKSFPQGLPLFKIPMKVVFPEFIMGPDPASWYYACSVCQRRDPDGYCNESSHRISLCVKELCSCVPGGHLRLSKYETESGVRYTISTKIGMPALNVAHVEIAENGPNDDWRRILTTLNVYLTIDVLMEVFRYDDSPHLRSETSFPLCENARQGRTSIVFLETFKASNFQ